MAEKMFEAKVARKMFKPLRRELVGTDGKNNDAVPWFIVADQMNRIFGPWGWDTEVLESAVLSSREVETRSGKTMWKVAGKSIVRVTIRNNGVTVVRTAVGVFSNMQKDEAGAMEVAVMGSESIALKRAITKLGPAFGLHLYTDKNVRIPLKEKPLWAEDMSGGGESKEVATASAPQQPTPAPTPTPTPTPRHVKEDCAATYLMNAMKDLGLGGLHQDILVTWICHKTGVTTIKDAPERFVRRTTDSMINLHRTKGQQAVLDKITGLAVKDDADQGDKAGGDGGGKEVAVARGALLQTWEQLGFAAYELEGKLRDECTQAYLTLQPVLDDIKPDDVAKMRDLATIGKLHNLLNTAATKARTMGEMPNSIIQRCLSGEVVPF